MANTSPTFFRKFEVFANIENILEPLTITLGFTGPVDDESGMILNLAEIDTWIANFKSSVPVKDKYVSSWSYARSINQFLIKKIPTKKFITTKFDFLDRTVTFSKNDVFIEWQQSSLIINSKKKWKSETVLTLQLNSKKWPPLSSVAEKKLKKKLQKIDLKKAKWTQPGFKFISWTHYDPDLKCIVKTN